MASEHQATNSLYTRLCYICLKTLKEQTSLLCGHTFCSRCLKRYISYSTSHNTRAIFALFTDNESKQCFRFESKLDANRKYKSVDREPPQSEKTSEGRKISSGSSPCQLQMVESRNSTWFSSCPAEQSDDFFCLKISAPSSEDLSQHDSSPQLNEPILQQQQPLLQQQPQPLLQQQQQQQQPLLQQQQQPQPLLQHQQQQHQPLLQQQQQQKPLVQRQGTLTESSVQKDFTESPSFAQNPSFTSTISSPYQPFHCPVCYKYFSTSPPPIRQDTNSTSEFRFTECNTDLVKCDSCENAREFFCSKCNINLCLDCRQQHDSMTLFKEHPVVYVVSKDNSDVLICFKHDKKHCTYFCLNCKSPLCVLCVMRHKKECLKENDCVETKLSESQEPNLQDETNINKTSNNNVSDANKTGDNNDINSNDNKGQSPPSIQTTTQSHYYYQQPSDQPVNQTSAEAQNETRIVKLRDAIGNVRENLKSILNLLGSHLNRLKGKLNYFSRENYYQPRRISPVPHYSLHNRKKSFCYIADKHGDLAVRNEFPTTNKPHNLPMFKNLKNESSRLNSVFRILKNKLKHNTDTKQVHKNCKLPLVFPQETSPTLTSPPSNCKLPLVYLQETSPALTSPPSEESSESDTQEEKISWNSSSSNKNIFSSFRKKFHKGVSLSHKNGLNNQQDSKSTVNSESVESLDEDDKKMVWVCELAICSYEKLMKVSTNALESSQVKRLYSVYKDLSDRVRVVVETELVELERELDNMFLKRHQRTMQTSSGSNLSRIHGASEDERLMEGWLDVPSVEVTESPSTSPNLLARPFQIWKYEKNRNEFEGTSIPCDLVFLEREGKVVVAEYDNVNHRNNRLQLIDASTGCLNDALLEGQIHPLGMALSRDQQHLIVSDCKSKRVKIISLATGSVVMEMGKGQFGWPYGVSVSGRGVVVVSDAFNDCILLFSPDGKKLRSFGSTGSQVNQFRNPYHLASDLRERIYVSDSGNDSVKVFDINGNFEFIANDASRRHSSTAGEGTAERKRRKLKGPRGVAVDERGNIFVADDHNRVSMFDSQGSFTRFLLTEEDMVRYPEALCYSNDGGLFISEWSPGSLFSVKMFSLYNNGV